MEHLRLIMAELKVATVQYRSWLHREFERREPDVDSGLFAPAQVARSASPAGRQSASEPVHVALTAERSVWASFQGMIAIVDQAVDHDLAGGCGVAAVLSAPRVAGSRRRVMLCGSANWRTPTG